MDLDFARAVIRTEAEAVGQVGSHLGEAFVRAGMLILERTGERPVAVGPPSTPSGRSGSDGPTSTPFQEVRHAAGGEGPARTVRASGRLVVTGVGKAGKVGDKISATFASTGTPSFFLNPTDALHGDLGMVSPEDVALVLSNSGRNDELLRLVPHLRKIGLPVVVVTGDATSPLAMPCAADVVLSIGKVSEAGETGLAPTSSTAAMMALGDALALSVQKERRFTGEQFLRFHPEGQLARLSLPVRDVMRTGARVPTCLPETPVREAIRLISEAKAGSVSVTDSSGRLVGIMTDGDFRRACVRDASTLAKTVGELMTREPRRIVPDRLVAEAMALMRDRKVNELPVVDASGRVVGLLDVQDVVGLRIEV